jgi:hypothetical protein
MHCTKCKHPGGRTDTHSTCGNMTAASRTRTTLTPEDSALDGRALRRSQRAKGSKSVNYYEESEIDGQSDEDDDGLSLSLSLFTSLAWYTVKLLWAFGPTMAFRTLVLHGVIFVNGQITSKTDFYNLNATRAWFLVIDGYLRADGQFVGFVQDLKIIGEPPPTIKLSLLMVLPVVNTNDNCKGLTTSYVTFFAYVLWNPITVCVYY